MAAVQPASVGRRLAAAAVDGAIYGGGVIGVVVAVSGVLVRRAPDRDPEALKTRLERLAQPGPRFALQAASSLYLVVRRNARTPGMRLLGLRRVDARTGGQVSVRDAVVGQAVRSVSSLVTHQWSQRRPDDSMLVRAVIPALVLNVPPLLARGHRSLAWRLAGVVTVHEP